LRLKITTEAFLSKLTKKYPDITYSFDKVEYIRSSQKIIVTCPMHGDFAIQPSNLLNGIGCGECGKIKAGIARRLGKDVFVEKSEKLLGNTYDYSLVEYVNNATNITIICKKHGSFQQTPASHLRGCGCTDCGHEATAKAKTRNINDFVADSFLKHKDRYDYTETEYVGNKKKVSIGCRIHGVFKQSPEKHLAGRGCPKCAKHGYNRGMPGCLYILQHDNITKIGITNSELKERLRRISKTSGKIFKCLLFIRFENGEIADDIESALLKELRDTYEGVSEKFDGSTECFMDVDYPKLLKRITTLVGNSYPSNP
jgi:hypothetical protein